MGEVYQARDTKLDRDVALKVLPEAFTSDPDRLARFEREAKVLASLNHPNIGTIYGLEEAEGVKALVLELIEGPTLADRIKKGPIPIDEALPIAKQIAEALEAAHEAGVIHRDLKPANIKVRPDGTVKVLDFGLAKAFQPDASDPNMSLSPTIALTAAATQMGMVIGTAAYMAPEQAKGLQVDRRADIWAYGCLLFEMLTARRVFDSRDVSEVLASVILKEPDLASLPTDVPPRLRELVARCLVKDPKDRLRDVGEARLALRDLDSGSVAAEAVTEPASASRPPAPRWRVAPVLVGAVVATSLVTGLLVWLVTRPAAPDVARFDLNRDGAEALSVSLNYNDIAISPDGRQVVYLSGRALNSSLIVRPLDALAGRSLEATAAVFSTNPFVSPNGAWVGFVNRQSATLQKVSMLGGPALTICELPSARLVGASWGDDETIVFGTAGSTGANDGLGLWTVSAAGGMPKQLTEAEDGVNHAWPDVLPDGRGVLFTILNGDLETAEVAVLDPETGAVSVLVPGGFAPRYVPTGHLVYAAAGSLRAVAFDLNRLEVTSAPVPVVDGLLTKSSGAALFGVADDGSLVYVTGEEPTALPSTLVWVDRDEREEPVDAPLRDYRAVALSPDRERVAVGVLDTGGNEDVWVWDLLRRTFTRLTRDEGSERNPIWTPDGARIVFESDSGMFWMAADGTGDIEQIPGSEPGSTPFTWAGDGRLVFDFLRPDGRDIRAMPLDGDAAETLLDGPFGEQRGTIAPDGRWLAYESLESGDYEIYVRPFPDVDAGRWQISTSGGREPTWSTDGSELFYVEPSSDRLVVTRVNPTETFEWDAPEALFSIEPYTGGASRNYAVGRDGRRFLFKRSESGSEDGTEDRQLILVQHWFEELKARVPVN